MTGDEPERTYTADEYIEYGVVQYRRGSTQARHELGAPSAPPSLDVERLAEAIKARRDLAPYRPSQESFLMVDWLEFADAIAVEYARLRDGVPLTTGAKR